MGSLFKPQYAPEGMRYADAKATGLLRESDVWWLRYRQNGRSLRESARTTDHAEAKRLLKLREGSVAKGEVVSPKVNRVRFSEMAELIRQDYEVNRKDLGTLEARLRHLEPVFGARRMVEINAESVDRYIAQRRGEEASNGTINRELGVLGRAFGLGIKKQKLTVAYPVRNHRLAEAVPRQGFFERDELLAVATYLPEHLVPVVFFAYETGWRVSEVVSRQWSHVDLGQGTARLEPGETKNKQGRLIYLTPELVGVLRALRERADDFERRRDRTIPWVFFRPDGRPVKSFRKAWATACDAAGVPGRIFHDFRRTAVRNLVRRTVNVETAMKMTGHRTRDVFARYNIVSEQDLREARDKIAGQLPLVDDFGRESGNESGRETGRQRSAGRELGRRHEQSVRPSAPDASAPGRVALDEGAVSQ